MSRLSRRRHGVLPGFAPALSLAGLYVGLVVVLPLAALALRASSLTGADFLRVVTAPRALAAYRLSFGAALLAALLNAVFGLLVAWVLARYRFPGRAFLDALVDFPFALPTAVAGLTLTALWSDNGWIGRFLEPLGLKVAFAPAGIVLALTFVGLPFVVRAVQPVLQDLDPELEEAAGVLGASRLQAFLRVLLPNLLPPLLTGFTLAFARALGEYGSIVFISGNLPMKTEIAPLLIVTKLEQYDEGGATAIAVVLLLASFALVFAANALQRWTRRLAGASAMAASRGFRPAPTLAENPAVRRALVAAAVGFLGVFVLLPLASVFAQAFRKGPAAYVAAITEPNAVAAIRLTLLTAAIVVPFHLAFGLLTAWSVAKFRFRGKGLLVTLVDLPFAVSPVIGGLVFVLLFGRRGFFGPLLAAHDWKVIYAVPGIVLATLFVTFPFVTREVLAVMEALGNGEEEAALTLGAGGWQTFFRVTLPKVRWGLLYGVVLCNARAMGEFGAVSVVSGHIRGLTNTIPLHVEILYNEYDMTGAFAVASLLTFLALVTLAVRKLEEARVAAR
jgi:sulfate ABC transporter permease protein CysT/sulfate ABC transporter permease protein CysW